MEKPFDEANLISIREVVKSCCDQTNKKKHYYCPCCDKYGVFFFDDCNRAKCCKCGKTYSTIDYFSEYNNISLNESAFKILESNFDSYIKEDPEELVKKREAKYQENYKRNLKYHKLVITEEAKNYLQSRGIFQALERLDKRVIEIRSNKLSIFYNFKKQQSGIQRIFTEKTIWNQGSVKPLLHVGYKNDIRILICEGIEDGISAHILGYNFISLNSVSNTGELIKLITAHKDYFRDKELLLCLDNDKEGKESETRLQSALTELGVRHTIPLLKHEIIEAKVKDINDYLKQMLKKDLTC